MLTLETTIEKTCLIGLTYFTAEGEMLKQSLLAGKVSSCDAEKGIGIALFEKEKSDQASKQFLIPTDLSCWFTAPKGKFHTSVEGITVTDPNYLITWDIYQTRSYKQESDEGEAAKPISDKQSGKQGDEQMQWWEWKPRTEQPKVG
ncbi:hypothetical protein [Shewanella benthica]|uniref:Uncharacterized protein n=1 Tax=Shewanella benthica KT99 TaxID=314608 RepID=A9DIC5_9GAMM|nr:hypothetical protein [Shewanella benthica]EDP99079.1 hypothetical protein KT99_10613 [Shewanella benthica KT99]